MKIKKQPNYTFENDVFKYESCMGDFNSAFYKEFDEVALQKKLETSIDDLFSGKLVNTTENQAALHPKYRSPKMIYEEECEQVLNKFLKNSNLLKNNETRINIITIGIGGSYEGPKLLLEISDLNNKKNNFKFEFITGSDLYEFKSKMNCLDPENTYFIVFSKTFNTDETIETFKEALKWSGQKDKFLAITANPLEASKYLNLETNVCKFEKEIGGRHSIWLNLVSSIYAKDSDRSFQQGGHKADLDLQNNNDYFNLIKYLSYSDIWMHNKKSKYARVVLSYIWKLRSFPNYIQQLEMESLGKPFNKSSGFKKTGQIIFGGYGPMAQHSYFQMLHQGTHELCADIISSRKDPRTLSYAQANTQSILLSSGADKLKEYEKINGNIPVNIFLLNKTDLFTLGYLIATWEHRTYVSSVILGINPFDQFGVNAGKIYTKKYLTKKK